MARPTGVGRGITTYDIPIEGRISGWQRRGGRREDRGATEGSSRRSDGRCPGRLDELLKLLGGNPWRPDHQQLTILVDDLIDVGRCREPPNRLLDPCFLFERDDLVDRYAMGKPTILDCGDVEHRLHGLRTAIPHRWDVP